MSHSCSNAPGASVCSTACLTNARVVLLLVGSCTIHTHIRGNASSKERSKASTLLLACSLGHVTSTLNAHYTRGAIWWRNQVALFPADDISPVRLVIANLKV